jgi:hypothetical protein
MSGAARRSVTAAPVASAPPPPKAATVPAPVPLRKTASTAEPAAKAQPPPKVVPPAGSDAASPAAKAEKPKASSAAKKAPAAAPGGFFGGFVAQVMAENEAASKKSANDVSPVVTKAAVAKTSVPTAADSDSDEAEFGSHLPAATRATTRSKGVIANGRDTSHRSDDEDDVDDDDVDTAVTVEEREPTAMDTYAASFEARTPLAPGKMLKKVWPAHAMADYDLCLYVFVCVCMCLYVFVCVCMCLYVFVCVCRTGARGALL